MKTSPRPDVQNLLGLGPLTSSEDVTDSVLQQFDNGLRTLDNAEPLTHEEIEGLLELFGPDDCFGIAWSLLHLIEKSPNWDVKKFSLDLSNEWHKILIERQAREKKKRNDLPYRSDSLIP